ncbi:Uncharacterized protein Rs2_06057 [Raphanus sativus]|nr:Uncharacterized protein Rs2_06057 [Raphanus sativus]
MSCRRKNSKTEAREEPERVFESKENATEKGRESYSPDELRRLTLKAAQSDAEEESEWKVFNQRMSLVKEKRQMVRSRISSKSHHAQTIHLGEWIFMLLEFHSRSTAVGA